MAERSFQRTREETARREVGHTDVGRGTAWFLALQFVLAILAAPLGEVLGIGRGEGVETLAGRLSRLVEAAVAPLAAEGPLFSRITTKNRAVIGELERFEDSVEDTSSLGRSLRPPTQSVLLGLGAGNEQAYIGRGDWLFYRDSFDYVTGPSVHTEALTAIVDFEQQLEARGIELLVMPAPVKPTVHPERFTSRFQGREEPLRPAWFGGFLRDLAARGVLVLDPAPALLEIKRRTGTPQYLMTDTHWRAEAGERVAAALRDVIVEHVDLPAQTPAGYVGSPTEATNLGDIARLLDLPADQTRYPEETVSLRQIRSADGSPWQASRAADVLLLGDSFSNIYSLGEMGWGESAGLAAQLSYLLQRPVDAIIRNADGAFATREALARELRRGEDRLAGKRLVIFQFAERELAVGDWRRIGLELGERAPGEFFVPEPGEQVLVTGTIREIAPVPEPESVPYEDHITAAHLVDLVSDREGVSGGQALVYLWGMRDRVLQPAARFQAGDRVTARLRPWSDVSSEYDGISRTEVENESAEFETPNWGEVLD